ncbi:MAG: aldehyde dehydrogenase family protein [Proteobacteria bacterium]|nr:aldehyde dehydrogenase family protein [Pseudomonadota bacterium]
MNEMTSSVIRARNPRTGHVDYTCPAFPASGLDALIAGLRAAQPNWETAGIDGRATALRAFCTALAARREDLLDALLADTGRLHESRIEADAAGVWVDRWLEVAPRSLDTLPRDTGLAGITGTAGFRPYPVVGVIGPWNFPLALGLMDAIPALVAGCAVILKPSEVAPRFVDVLQAALDEVPALAAIFRVVRGDGALGAAIVDQVDMVCFTGSTRTGRLVARRAAERFIPCFTELGGKDPALVLEGADIDRATSALATGATLGAGQQCYSIERIYVPRSLHDGFVAQLAAKVARLRPNWPDPAQGHIGPITFLPQAEILRRHLDDAIERGARIVTGGAIETHGGGLWCQPTVLTDVDHSMLIMREESFGPFLPVMAYDSLDEAVALANDSHYGLSAAVFGPEEAAQAVARRLDAGGVSINDAGLAPLFIGSPLVPEKTAFNHSGLGGSRTGADSIRRFVRKQAILSNPATGPSPWWFSL